ncbi:MAG: PKD domain-containing protein [Candidatus Bathyarchaeota archaeon]|nr:MAG: PKD domain-containing protein [Candidatus Bathyarchaeota archaeon]
MNRGLSKIPSLLFRFTFLGILALSSFSTIPVYAASLSITLNITKQSYYLRDSLSISGNVTFDGIPVSTALVALEIQDDIGLVALRTLPTGDISASQWPVEITNIMPSDSVGDPVTDFKIAAPFTASFAYFHITIKNNEPNDRNVIIAVTVFDGNSVALPGAITQGPYLLRSNTEPEFVLTYPLLNWPYRGTALACAGVYSTRPSNGGVAICPESYAAFQITDRYGITTFTGEPNLTPDTINGTYNATLKLHPEMKSGEGIIYSSATYDGFESRTSSNYEILQGPYPPQAAFSYSPADPFVNQTITFDGAASSAEGYNDNITRFEWDFGDGSPPVIRTGNPAPPTTTHQYTQNGTYVVTLNVTDTEGLWSTTAKPISVQPPIGPTADFTWSPPIPNANQSVRFDASSSLPGWNGVAEAPIVDYTWNFGDGNITSTSSATIDHTFTSVANYTVSLTVTDTQGLNDTLEQTVIVSEAPPLIGDVNGDGIVDITDIVLVIDAFGTTPGSPGWNSNYDLNNDLVVDITDITIVIVHFGETL